MGTRGMTPPPPPPKVFSLCHAHIVLQINTPPQSKVFLTPMLGTVVRYYCDSTAKAGPACAAGGGLDSRLAGPVPLPSVAGTLVPCPDPPRTCEKEG